MKAINQIIGSIYQNIGDYVFDKKYGLDTVLRVDLSKRSSGNNYQPTGLFRSRKILDRLKKHGNSGLVDFGSGKGQFLLTAASLNFTSVKGIEFVKEIHSIAEKNIATFCSKRSKIDVPISISLIFLAVSENEFSNSGLIFSSIGRTQCLNLFRR